MYGDVVLLPDLAEEYDTLATKVLAVAAWAVASFRFTHLLKVQMTGEGERRMNEWIR